MWRRSAPSWTSAYTRMASCTSRRCQKTFVKDPREVVKPGDIVCVKVLEVDIPRKRVALTLRLDDELGPRTDRAGTAAPRNDSVRPTSRGPSRSAAPTRREEQGGGALAD